ncbi:MAG: helix-turn-helix domain-containing protein [Proteobacteria bacterium]|nr:helix-turn-helix domain-containing protein [Pseudomonadota bacterium]
MRRGVGRSVSVGSYEHGQHGQDRHDAGMHRVPVHAQAESRVLIARFFIDLRQALRLTVPQAAHYLQVQPDVIEAFETGQVEYLPPWSETAAIIMTYTSMAGVNGRPVINAIGTLLTHLSVPAAPSAAFPAPGPMLQPAPSQWPSAPPQRLPQVRQMGKPSEPDAAPSGLATSSRNLLRAGSAIANGARRLPQEALKQVRRRPQRALYALSLPLGLLVISMHSSIFASVARPFEMAVQRVSTYIQEHYGPVRDGMRYIEVDDPETRRADKLQIGSSSY